MNPFLTRRDFDLVIMYFILTRKVELSVEVCRSYQTEGGYNPFSKAFNFFLMLNTLENPPSYEPRDHLKWTFWDEDGYTLRLEGSALPPGVKISENVAGVAMFMCGGFENIRMWGSKMITEHVFKAAKVHEEWPFVTDKASVSDLIKQTSGVFLVNKKEDPGFVDIVICIDCRDSHEYVYEWSKEGLFRHEHVMMFVELLKKAGKCVTVKKMSVL